MVLGDVQLKGSDDKVYTLNFGVNAMCRLEDQDDRGRSYQDLLDEMRTGKPSMRTVRALAAAALVEPKNATLEQVGEILEDIGGPLVLLAAWKQSDDAIAEIGRELDALLTGQRSGGQPTRAVN